MQIIELRSCLFGLPLAVLSLIKHDKTIAATTASCPLMVFTQSDFTLLKRRSVSS